MSWLKLDPAGSSMSEHDFRLAVQEHYLNLFLPHADGFDWDVAAFYRSRDERPIYYFSPGAADLLLKFGKFSTSHVTDRNPAQLTCRSARRSVTTPRGLSYRMRFAPIRSSTRSLQTPR